MRQNSTKTQAHNSETTVQQSHPCACAHSSRPRYHNHVPVQAALPAVQVLLRSSVNKLHEPVLPTDACFLSTPPITCAYLQIFKNFHAVGGRIKQGKGGVWGGWGKGGGGGSRGTQRERQHCTRHCDSLRGDLSITAPSNGPNSVGVISPRMERSPSGAVRVFLKYQASSAKRCSSLISETNKNKRTKQQQQKLQSKKTNKTTTTKNFKVKTKAQERKKEKRGFKKIKCYSHSKSNSTSFSLNCFNHTAICQEQSRNLLLSVCLSLLLRVRF